MAFAQVQTSTQTNSSASSVNTSLSATTAGNLVVVHIRLGGVSETCTGVSDNAGNTYVLSSALTVDVGFRMYQAYAVQTSGGATTVTATFSGASSVKRVGADEYSGGESSNAAIFDASTTGSDATFTSSAIAASTLTAAASGELFVGTLASNNDQTFTAGTGFTLYNTSASAIRLRSHYKLSGGASETGPATLGSATSWGEILTAFKPASGGGGGSTRANRLTLLGVG